MVKKPSGENNKKVAVPKRPIRTTKDVGEMIRAVRKESGLTLVQAAALCNVGVRFFSELENGKENVRLSLVLKVLGSLGLTFVVTKRKVFNK